MRFRRLLAISLLLTSVCLVLGAGLVVAHQDAPDSTTVYVTKSGTKYHKAGCSSLSRSAIPMRLDEAATRYGPCSRCRPPVWQPSASAKRLPPAPPAAVTSSASQEVFLAVGGSVYHLDRNCKGLTGRQTVTSKLSDVQTPDYGLCSVCGSSPVDASGLVATPAPTASGRSGASATTSSPGRCQATTKKGTQCSRKAQPGSQYCWQHQR